MARRQGTGFAVWCAAMMLLSTGISVEARDWARYTSANFTVYSDARPATVELLLNQFEVFRVIALVQLGLPWQQPENQRLVILMYDSGKDFHRTGVGAAVGGFYTNIAAGPRMVMGPGGDTASTREILYHEYTHYLFFQHSTFNYPRWYLEGIADVLSSAVIRKDGVVIGAMPRNRKLILDYLGFLDIEDLVALRDRGGIASDFQYRFYATAWALTHYLLINSAFENKELAAQTTEYLQRYHNGEDPLAVFEETFGMTPARMTSVVRNYLTKSKIPAVKWNKPDYAGGIVRTEITDNEKNYVIADVIAGMAHRKETEEVALEYLSSPNPADPYYAEIQSLRAIMLNHRQDAEAASIAASALKAGPDNAVVLANLAHYEWDRYTDAAAKSLPVPLALDNAEEYARKAIALDKLYGGSYRFLADIQVMRKQINPAIETLVAADNLFPYNTDYRVRLVKVLLDAQRPDLAKPFVKSLIGAVHTETGRRRFSTLLEQIDSGNVDMSIFEPQEGEEAGEE
ncbi:MAG: hypothetical protein H6978_16240 [Gammaproteobacteria bacterium]|nr:hypothetical protein [Gammaproteobacteria bacterium]